ncbi:MAG TPA: hypothetical protein VL027_06730 [Spongiibacteraceae bacterium]|jgi:hypothetical protein|nr:hypothetical protein [Spongiibacteraceae bacterium]HUH37622.1 hypothetical protein [Spongiibacteraceae bacterium]
MVDDMAAARKEHTEDDNAHSARDSREQNVGKSGRGRNTVDNSDKKRCCVSLRAGGVMC